MHSSKETRHYWFKRRRYGWGWVPTSWQGWASVFQFVVLLTCGAWALSDTPKNTLTLEVVLYIALVCLGGVALIALGYRKGPSPKWRWGKRPDDNPDEDW